MQVGDKVTVMSSVVVFNHPNARGNPYELKGHIGEIVVILENWNGKPISPNLPVVVAFGRYKAHFRHDELSQDDQ